VGCQQILHYPDFAARTLLGEDNASSVGVNAQVPHAATCQDAKPVRFSG